MKQSVKQPVMFIFLLFMPLAYYSCESIDKSISEDYSVRVQHSGALPEGNILNFLNGNVSLDIMPGSVTIPVSLSVNECQGLASCSYVLKTIAIEPVMSFNVPVNVSLRYDGELVNEEIPIEDCYLIIYSWEKQECYFNGGPCETICCHLDKNNRTINFPISQTGIFAVGTRSLENPGI